jgi:hypothetical protein
VLIICWSFKWTKVCCFCLFVPRVPPFLSWSSWIHYWSD